MKHLNTAILLAACATALGGCATDGPATNGDAVRAAVAAQIVPPAPRAPALVDGATAVESYKNVVDSYNFPRPQVNDSAFRR